MGMIRKTARRLLSLMLCLLLWSMAIPAGAVMTVPKTEYTDRLAAEIRYSPSSSSLIIGCLTDGTEVTVLGEKGDYFRIDCAGMTGYIDKEQIVTDENGCCYVNCKISQRSTVQLPCCADEERDTLRQQLLELAQQLQGVPYVWGGTSPRGFDCSGFVQYMYRSIGYDLNRTCSQQLCGGVIVEKEQLQPGDILFFTGTTWENSLTSHVGIYVGEGMFVHTGNRGVVYDSLDSAYYSSKYLCARRVILVGMADIATLPNRDHTQNRSSDLEGRSFFAFILRSQTGPHKVCGRNRPVP